MFILRAFIILSQWNFFIHNLGQMKFSETEGDGGGGELLSFVPKRYS